jgi:glycosyltransferase involved in cell wall biosynthesis
VRIGIISTVGGYSWAGSEEMWKVLATEALRTGHSVAVSAQAAISESEELAEFRDLGGVSFPYRSLNWWMRRIAERGWYSRFNRMKRWKPDLLCVSGGPYDMYKEADIMAFLRADRSPQVFIIQGNADGFISGQMQRDSLRRIYLSASRIVCVCRENAILLERQVTSALPIVILPNPIRSRLARPLPWPDAVNDVVRFATVGRYEVGSKCQDRTLQALATPEWKDRNWRLNFFGSGPDHVYLRDLIRYYGLEDRAVLQGFERDFTKIWTDHHVHILNSRAEGLALALIESMFCGRPAVITRSGGNHELLRDEKDGFVSPGEDPEIIRQTLERAWVNRQRWQAMGDAAFKRVTEWVPPDLGSRLLTTITEAGVVGSKL